jgi:hypothetical protein
MRRVFFLILLIIFCASGWVIRQGYIAYARNQALVVSTMTEPVTTTAKLNELKRYVMSHSGSSVTVVLTATYNQAVSDVQAAQALAATPSTSLYAQAQAACAGRGVSSITQAQCNQSYIQNHSAGSTTTPTATPPSLADYTYPLVAPILTLDGASILFALGFISLIGVILPHKQNGPKGYL